VGGNDKCVFIWDVDSGQDHLEQEDQVLPADLEIPEVKQPDPKKEQMKKQAESAMEADTAFMWEVEEAGSGD